MKTQTLRCLAVLTAVMMVVCGCKKGQDPEPEKDSFASDKASPSWTAPAEHDFTSSMTAVVKVDLAAQYPVTAADFVLTENDVLAAFVDSTCVGVAQDTLNLFFLYVAATEGSVSLRYYSAHYKNIFEAKDAFPFKNDDHLGTTADPFTPTFVVMK